MRPHLDIERERAKNKRETDGKRERKRSREKYVHNYFVELIGAGSRIRSDIDRIRGLTPDQDHVLEKLENRIQAKTPDPDPKP